MLPESRRFHGFLQISESLYLLFILLSFYLLTISRTGEAQTVWKVLNPLFIPALFVATFLLFSILFASEKTSLKLLFVIIYTILIHSLFSIIFPAGDLSGQQSVLGRTRLVFDNTVLHGLSGWPTTSLDTLIIEIFNGTNLQAALSTVFARMLGVDILYIHLFYIPILWGIFVPFGAFLITKSISGNDTVAVISSLIIAAFPYASYFGAISVPNSLGFIFFLYSLYFMLKYLSSSNSKNAYLMLGFALFSMLAHFLAGAMAFSLLIMAIVFKVSKNEEKPSSNERKFLFALCFFISASLLSLSLISLKLFGVSSNPVFTLDKVTQLSVQQSIGLFLLGDLAYSFDLTTIALFIVGPIIAFLAMIILIFRSRNGLDASFREKIIFVFAAFLIMVIDYGILKVFMKGLPFNEERIWVFRDLIAAPFVGLAISAVFSSAKRFLEAKSIPNTIGSSLKAFSKDNFRRIPGLFLVLNIVAFALLGGWVTFSLSAAYPQVAPIQTTSFELNAVRYIDASANEKYVVIGDIWTTYAGEVVAGINNPRAYYFQEDSKIGHDLFVGMRENPSPPWMLQAMNYTDTEIAYFMVTEIRLGSNDFNSTVSLARQNSQLTEVSVPNVSPQELCVFSYKKGN